jgi:hypothetical protein
MNSSVKETHPYDRICSSPEDETMRQLAAPPREGAEPLLDGEIVTN